MVYGHPAIAAAIDLRTHLSVIRSQRTTVNGEMITSSDHPHLVELMHRLSIDVPLEIEIRSEVPGPQDSDPQRRLRSPSSERCWN